MAKKQFTILIVILAVAVLAAVAVRTTRTSGVKASMTGIGERVLPDFPINQVAAISIATAEGTQTLERKEEEEGNVWTVAERGGYPADFAKVSNLLREIWELKIAQNIEAGPSQFGRLGLVEAGGEEAGDSSGKTGTLLEFKGADEAVLASLLVGNEYTRQSDTPSPFGGTGEIPAGRYIKAGGKDEVWLVSETLSTMENTTENWLVKDFFEVEGLKSIEKKSPDTEQDWKIARKTEDDNWRLLFLHPGEVLDDAKISGLTNAFGSPRFDDVVPGAKDVGEGATEFVLNTFDGFKYNVAVGKELEDRKHHITVKVDARLPTERKAEEGESEEDKKTKDEEFKKELEQLEFKLEKEKKLADWVYLVPNHVAGSLFKNRSEIIKTPEAGSEPAKPVVPPAKLPVDPPKASAPKPLSPLTPKPMGPPKPPATEGATAVTEPIEINFEKKPGEKEVAEEKVAAEKKAAAEKKPAEPEKEATEEKADEN